MSATVMFEGRVQKASLRRIRQALVDQPARMYPLMRRTLRDWGLRWEGEMAKRMTAPLPPPGGPNDNETIHTSTGALRRSMKSKLSGSDLGSLRLRMVSAGALHARLQEYGGVVRAKKGGFLTIPLPGNLEPTGGTRYGSARQFISQHPGQTFFLRTKEGDRDRLVLMWNDPSKAARKSAGAGKGEAVPMFLLVKKVEIPGPLAPTKRRASRLGFFDTWAKQGAERSRDLARVARALVGGP